ncbi:hypothetical protein PS15m_005713 [Mucor circinelloides]
MNYQNNNIFNPQNNAESWNFMDYSSSQQQQPADAPLQEPVAFEDFQFSLGLDPEFAMPIPLDIPPPPPPMNESDFYNMEAVPAPMNHAVLDEQDHKAFSQFLDQFFVDPNMQIDPQFTMYDTQHPPPMSLDNHHQHHHPHHPYQQTDEEYHRQSSILQSLDEQKRYYNKDSDMHHHHQQQHNQQYQDRPGAVYLQQSNAITAPFIKTPVLRETSSLSKQTSDENETSNSPSSSHSGNGNQGSSNSGNNSGGGAIRRGKPHKELLTEEEKRNNHIASEQKRRSMIRSGFKDLTEIVPTLKNINNSKSTVLFKAVDYIKYLDKRNRNLREKIKNLEVRVEVEGRMGILSRPTATSSTSTNQPYYKSSSVPTQSAAVAQPRRVESNAINHTNIHNTTTSTNTSSAAPSASSNKTASAALLQHKTQQRQLMELQEKLQLHQKMLAQQQQQQQQQHQQQHQQQKSLATPVVAADINRPYHIYDQSHHHHHRWHNDKAPETKMDVDATTAAPPSDSLIKATVSA